MRGLRSTRVLLGAFLVLSAHQAVGQTVNLFGQNWTGDGTYYGDAGGAGTCSFQYSDSASLPWASGTAFRVAMDQPFFYGSQTCGMCLAMHGTGPGSGANPVPLTTQYVLVSNLCPECKAGDLDQEISGDGRWTIKWYPVQCAVGSTPFVYSFQNSNPYYVKMQVSNHRVPVQSMQWFFSGTWYDMSRTSDNYFVIQAINSQPLILPAQVKITSIFGDEVIDTVATSSFSGRLIGNVQFPSNTALQTVPDPTADTSATPAPDTSTPAPPVATPPPDTPAPINSPPPADTPAATLPPVATPVAVTPPAETPAPVPPPTETPAAAAPPLETPATLPPPQQTPAAVPPPVETPAAVPPPVETPAAVPPPVETPAAVPPPAEAPSSVPAPAETPVAMAPPPFAFPPAINGPRPSRKPKTPSPAPAPSPPASSAPPAAPVPAPSPPDSSAPPAAEPPTDATTPTYIPPTASAPPAADGSSAWDAAAAQSMHLTPAQIAQLTPGYSPAPSKDGKVVLAPYAQCGGINNAPTPAQSGDFPWKSTVCSEDFQCLTNANPWFYQCVPVPEGLNPTSLAKHLPLTTALAATLNKDTSCTRYIPSYGQCGGSAGSCYGDDCLDAVWDKACCSPTMQGEATTCVRQSAMRWMCQLESMVNTKAFAKSVRKGAYGASLGSVTELAKLQGAKAKSYRIALASSLAAAQARPATSDLSVPALQAFYSVVSHGTKAETLQQIGGTAAEQIRSGVPSGNSTAGQSIISGEHIDTSNLKGVPVDPTTGNGMIAGIEASMPIANFTLGQATRYIIAGITEVSAGDNCTIWVDQGVQCGGQGGACHAEFCVDQQWDGSCCLHPLNRCQRFDSNYWECRTGSTFVSAE